MLTQTVHCLLKLIFNIRIILTSNFRLIFKAISRFKYALLSQSHLMIPCCTIHSKDYRATASVFRNIKRSGFLKFSCIQHIHSGLLIIWECKEFDSYDWLLLTQISLYHQQPGERLERSCCRICLFVYASLNASRRFHECRCIARRDSNRECI